MKKISTLIILFFLLCFRSNAQYVPVTLEFQQMIQSVYPTQSAGIFNDIGYMDTTATFVRTLRHMDIHGLDQSIDGMSLLGIQYFDSLEYLDCSGNSIGDITTLPPNLDTLICSNQLYPLFFHWTTLFTLPTLPVSLKYLDCSGNDITAISALPSNLTWLDCSNQYYHMSTGDIIFELVSLPALPSSLRYLRGSISNSNFSQLPFSLIDMGIIAPNMTQLPELPPGLAFLDIEAPLTCLPALPASMAGNSPYNTLTYNLSVSGSSVTCIPNAVTGMVQNPSLPILPVCNGSNNPNGCPNQPVFGAASAITGLRTIPGVASASASYTLYGYNLSTATGNITISTPTSSLEISTDNTNFSTSPIVIPYTNSQVSVPVYVRISNTAPLGPVSANIINSTTGLTDVYLAVSGDVVNPFLEAGPAITQLNGFTGEPSAALAYTVNAMGLTPAAGNISITPSTGLEVSTDNINFSSTASLAYTNGSINSVKVYVRLANPVTTGGFSGTVTNSGGSVPDAIVLVGGTVSFSGIITGPDITGLNTVLGTASASVYSSWVPQHIYPANGSATITASPGFEVDDIGLGYASTLNLPYSAGMNDMTSVRISSSAPAGPIAGTITYTIPGYPAAVVNVSGYVHAPLIAAGPSITGLSTVTGTASVAGTYTLSATDLSPSSGNLSLTASANLELSTDNVNFSSSLVVPYTGGALAAMTVYVRISAAAPAGAINGTVTNSGGGATNVMVSVTGNVSGPSITAGPAITGLITQSGTSSASASYNLSAAFLNPASGNLMLTASAGLEISTDNVTFWGSLIVPYAGGTLATMPIYVRITPFAPVGIINGTITNSGGGATDVLVSVSGNVSAGSVPVITAGPGISGLNTQSGTASASASYSLSGSDLNPSSGNITITASASLEVSTDNTNFSSSLSVPYTGGLLATVPIYVRISSSAAVGAVNGTITNSGGGATDAIVSVSGNVSAVPVPLITAGPDISGLNTQSGTTSASASYSLSGGDLNPSSGNITVTASAALEVSTDNTNFSSSISVPYTGGLLTATSIYVRISSSAPVGAINGTITNSGGGATDAIVSVIGNVSSVGVPVITAGPDIAGLSASGGNASASQTYTLSASDLMPATGDITVTPSSSLEVSTDNTNFSSSLSVPYSSGSLAATTIYVRIAAGTPTGTVLGTITNSGGGASDAMVQVSGNAARPAGITIGPNPARDMVTVYLPGNAAPVGISIVNENGQVLKTLSTNKESVQIYISNLSRGFYTIRLVGDNMAEAKRLIIN